jgi:hypothetical protein
MPATDERAERIQRLKLAAAARSADAESRARRALVRLENTGRAVTFVEVARVSGVSTSFLYQHPGIRSDIIRRRSGPHKQTRSATEAASAASLRTKLRVTTARCSALAEEVTALRAENETLRSELVALRHGRAAPPRTPC